MAEGAWRRWLPAIRLAAVLTVLVLATVAIVTALRDAGPPTRDELLEASGLTRHDTLKIGVKNDHPGLALHDPASNRFTGFDIEIAYMIAADLGFRENQVRFLAIETEDRARMQAVDANGEFVTVDLVIAGYSITPEREALETVTFSAPYLRTEQTVMTRKDVAATESLGSFRGEDRPMCTTGTSTSVRPLVALGIVPVLQNSMKTCVDGLLSGKYYSVSSDAVILAGFTALHPTKLKLHDIGLDTTESYGVNTGTNWALNRLVNLSLYNSRYDPADHRWENAFDEYLAAEQPAARPQQVAITDQPDVPEPPVRRWFWERGAIKP